MNVSPDKPKDVFISYNRADETWAQTLAERIEAEYIQEPSGSRPMTVFFAPWDIEIGTNFVNALADGLSSLLIYPSTCGLELPALTFSV